MPEKIVQAASSWWEALQTALLFSIIGVSIGLGQLLASKEKLTQQIMLGRALSTGGLAMAAGVVFVWYPDLPKVAQLGVAAALASLGTSGIERLLQRLFNIGGSNASGPGA